MNDMETLAMTDVSGILCRTYQKYGMCIVKWNFFYHICEEIKRNGNLFLHSADCFGYAHNIFKREYRKPTDWIGGKFSITTTN